MGDPASLLAMPVEIQLAICNQLVQCDTAAQLGSNLCTLENLPVLGGLALTCRHFQQITTPFLYQRVKVSIYQQAVFFRLIERFSRFPAHAALVKELTIDSSFDNMESTLSGVQADILLQKATFLGLKLPPGGIGMPFQPESMLIDALLCQVPTIRKLVLSVPWTVAAAHVQGEHPDYDGDVRYEVPSYALRLPDSFVLPSLRHIEVYPTTQSVPDSEAAALHAASLTVVFRCAPTLNYLRVQNCHLLDAAAIDAIAAFCPRLERFRLGPEDSSICLGLIDMLEDLVVQGLYPEYLALFHANDASRLCKLLLPLGATLRDLDLSDSQLHVPGIKHLSLMSGFESLRSLRLVFPKWPPGDNAMLIDNLPPTLESLCLGGHRIPVYDIAVMLAGRIQKGRLPKLRSFRYTLIREELEPEIAEITRALDGTGVDCAERPNSEPVSW